MSKPVKAVVVTVCVIVGLIIIASVVLRLVLTDEKLAALVTPRIERVVGAKVSIDDIGLRFPFGFGVDVGGLSLSKEIREGREVDFRCNNLTVNASLISLIRRRPEISDVEVEGGTLNFSDSATAVIMDAYGIKTHVSVMPRGKNYSIRPHLSIDSIRVVSVEKDLLLLFGQIGFRGSLQSDQAFDSLGIESADLNWSDVLRASFSGSVTGMTGEPMLNLHMETEETDITGLTEQLLTLRREGHLRLGDKKVPEEPLPVEIESGNFILSADLSGSAADPSGLACSGRININDIRVIPPEVEESVSGEATILFDNTEVNAQDVRVGMGDSEVKLEASLKLTSSREIEKISFRGGMDLILKDVSSMLKQEGVELDGRMDGEFSGEGTPDVLARLFPPGGLPEGDKLSRRDISRAWRDFTMSSKVVWSDVSFSSDDMPFRLSSLKGEAAMKDGNVENLEGSLLLSGSPFRFSGRMERFFPALAEVVLVARRSTPQQPVQLGEALDQAVNIPRVTINVDGQTLDLRPLEEAPPGEAEAGKREKEPAPPSLSGHSLMPLFLKHTVYSASIDSVVTRRAVVTELNVRGRVREGILKTDQGWMNYAGGKGDLSLMLDLRDPGRTTGTSDLTFKGIEAGRALEGAAGMGEFLEGRFFLDTHAEFSAGENVSPLSTLSATGSARSENGKLVLSSLVSSFAENVPVDLLNLRNLSYSDWRGDFTVKEGRFITDNWRMNSSSGRWSIEGSFGFDGTLDYSARLVVPPSVQREMKDLRKYGDLVDLFKDQKGNLILNFDLGGSVESPRFSLDMSKARERAGEKLLDSIKKKAKDWFK